MRTLLHKIAAGEDRVTLIPTGRDRLRAQTFLDGRSDFSSGPVIEASLTQWRDVLAPCSAPDRTIFHTGFCGSTLLARLLDVPGQSLVLREPNCLADLANQREGGAVLDLVRRHLRLPWADGEPVVVKPSNWANSLLPAIVDSGKPVLPVFLHMRRDAFLRAIFRGGDQRIAFAARAAVHLSNGTDGHALLVARALEAEGEDGLKLARLALVLFEIQMRLFSDACATAGWGTDRWLTHEELTDDPLGTAKRAADLLEIALCDADIEKNIRLWGARHAKSPGDLFSSSEERAANEALSASHGAFIEAALDWADANFG